MKYTKIMYFISVYFDDILLKQWMYTDDLLNKAITDYKQLLSLETYKNKTIKLEKINCEVK